MRGICSLGRVENQKLGSGAAAIWLLLPLVVLCVLKADFLPPSARRERANFPTVFSAEQNQSVVGENSSKWPTSLEGETKVSNSTAGGETGLTTFADEKVQNVSTSGTVRKLDVEKDQNNSNPGSETTTQPLDTQEKLQANISLSADFRQKLGNNSSAISSDDRTLPPAANDMTNHSLVNSETLHTEQKSAVILSLSADSKGEQGENTSPINSEEQKQHLAMNGTKKMINSDETTPKRKLTCDFDQPLTDTCHMDGDIRVQGSSSTVFVVSPSQYQPENATQKLRPYARKWEKPTMDTIKEVTIQSTPGPEETPPCAVTHDVPAVIFSVGGFSGNFFHTFSDILIPLYITTYNYNGQVQLLATDFNTKWIFKYQPLLSRLSNFQVINLDEDPLVRCFPSAHVGLESNKVLGINPLKTRNGQTMSGFRDFLRSVFSLERSHTTRISKESGKKPRLLMVLRRGSRALTNEEEVIAMATSLGYEVIAAGPEQAKDLHKFAQLVNSCDVMMGVHGAGLTNMVFLPNNATIIQIIPWGGLKWACWHDFGDPAPGMGLNYIEYEIQEEESSLIQKYPRDHAVFTDPISIHRQGFNAMWSTFLNDQNVKLDIDRFRAVLLGVLQSITE